MDRSPEVSFPCISGLLPLHRRMVTRYEIRTILMSNLPVGKTSKQLGILARPAEKTVDGDRLPSITVKKHEFMKRRTQRAQPSLKQQLVSCQ